MSSDKHDVNHLDSRLLDKFLTYRMDVENNRYHTIRTYRTVLGNLLEFLDEPRLDEVSFNDLDDFVNQQIRAGDGTDGRKEASAHTKRVKLMSIRAFWKWMVMIEDVAVSKDSRHILRKNVRVPDTLPNPVPDRLWQLLWASELYDDDRLWLGLAYFCGFRRFEILSITPQGVLPDELEDRLDLEGIPGIFHFERKGDEDQAWHRLPYREVIELYLKPRMGFVGPFDQWLEIVEATAKARQDTKFLSVYTVGQEVVINRNVTRWIPVEADGLKINRLLKKLLRQADLPPNAFKPHDLRDSAATNLFRAGVDLLRMRDLMNHSKLDTTRAYAKVSAAFVAERERNLAHAENPDIWKPEGIEGRRVKR